MGNASQVELKFRTDFRSFKEDLSRRKLNPKESKTCTRRRVRKWFAQRCCSRRNHSRAGHPSFEVDDTERGVEDFNDGIERVEDYSVFSDSGSERSMSRSSSGNLLCLGSHEDSST